MAFTFVECRELGSVGGVPCIQVISEWLSTEPIRSRHVKHVDALEDIKFSKSQHRLPRRK